MPFSYKPTLLIRVPDGGLTTTDLSPSGTGSLSPSSSLDVVAGHVDVNHLAKPLTI